MSKISTYSLADSPLQLSDRLIGTEAPRPTPSSTPLATKNFSLQELMQLFAANFPAPTLQAVLNAGNIATQNIFLTGTITSTLIKPTNIEDITGSQGTTFQVLSKAVSGINWVTLPDTATWGQISGTITNQTDLINYLSGNYYPLSSNPAGYLTGITSLDVVNALGYSPYDSSNPAGYISASFAAATYYPLTNPSNYVTASFISSNYVPQSRTITINGVTQDLSANRTWTVTATGAIWGSITGTVTNQTDLVTYLSTNYYPLSSNPAGYLTQDNVVEYASLAAFPPTGVIGTIYIALDTGFFYSWNGTTYVLSSPPSTGITGVGLTNYVGRWTSPTTMGTGIIRDDGSNVGIGTAPNASYRLNVNGSANISSFLYANVIVPGTAIIYDGGGNLGSRTRGGANVDYFAKGNSLIPGNITFSDGSYLTAGTETARFDTFNRRLGIRTTSPTEALDVDGNIRNRGAYYDISNASGSSGQVLSSTGTGTSWINPPAGGIPHATASGTDTYTATIAGVTAYADGDAYLIRFTNGNTTGCTLNINGLGAISLYRNNDGPLLGGDILAGGEMICIYNSTLVEFQVIGISPNSLIAYVTNDDSVTITKGMPVYAFSGTGDRMTVKRAKNTSDATSAQTVGLVLSTSIATNQKGFIMMQGLLDGLSILPTATWSDGDPVYLGATDGTITNVKPYAPNHLVYLGVVTTASNGSAGRLYVRVQNGYELQELHNVQAQSPSLKDTLWYDNTVSPAQWKTASIPTILGYTPPNLGLVQAMTQGLQNIF